MRISDWSSDVCSSDLGAGRGFCAGHDLKELRGRGGDKDFFQAIFKQCSRLMTTITALPQPVIAKVHGIATAAGCQLVANCALAVAERAAQFGPRSEDRRVGNEWGSTCTSRWSTDQYQKKSRNNKHRY